MQVRKKREQKSEGEEERGSLDRRTCGPLLCFPPCSRQPCSLPLSSLLSFSPHLSLHTPQQILAAEGGVVLTRDIAYSLFNRLREFPDWSQCVIMAVLGRFVPSTEDEVYDILVRGVCVARFTSFCVNVYLCNNGPIRGAACGLRHWHTFHLRCWATQTRQVGGGEHANVWGCI